MKYINGYKIEKMYDELNKYDNFVIENIPKFKNSLIYWGKTYENKYKYSSLEWISKEYERKLKENERKNKAKLKLSKLEDKKKKYKDIDWSNYTKEELIEILKIIEHHNEWLKNESDNTKKSKRFSYIHKYKSIFKISLSKVCKLFNVTANGYRKWVKNGCQSNQKFNDEWLMLIKKVFDSNLGNFGRGKIKEVLFQKYKLSLNHNTIYRYMKKLEIICEAKKWKRSKPPKEKKETSFGFENINGYDFSSSKLNQKWFIDESYLKISGNKYVYLCAIIDSYNNEIVSYKISNWRDSFLALDTLKMAINNRGDVSNLILTSDHGLIYNSIEFKEFCVNKNITQSMSNVGNSLHNRPIEFFFSVFKTEYLRHVDLNFRNLDSLRQLSISWINHYNYKRIQSTLDWKSPKSYLRDKLTTNF